jgi:hypothetical protein
MHSLNQVPKATALHALPPGNLVIYVRLWQLSLIILILLVWRAKMMLATGIEQRTLRSPK